jgi:hypothetical protein
MQMTSKTIKMTFDNLYFDLKTYGLNPKDWTLKKISKKQFQILNNSDSNFVLLGRSANNKKWQNLTLIDL